MNNVFNTVFIGVAVLMSFVYREEIKNIWLQSYIYYFPCRSPISYSIGNFDPKFGLSKEDFIASIKSAEDIWEKSIGKDLFNYDEGGSLKINLIYDVRQETTQKLQEMGIVVETNKASYDSLKQRYDSLLGQYDQQKREFESRMSTYDSRRKAYEAEVTAINKKGGANKATYDRLNSEKSYLSAEASALSQMQDSLNKSVSGVNTVAKALNELASTLNIGVKQYNNIGDDLGGEFDEGVYRSNSLGREIDIYQFDNKTKLIRVLAHELGHALGLDHIEDSKAIMYRLNNGINEKPTASDIRELKALCGVN